MPVVRVCRAYGEFMVLVGNRYMAHLRMETIPLGGRGDESAERGRIHTKS